MLSDCGKKLFMTMTKEDSTSYLKSLGHVSWCKVDLAQDIVFLTKKKCNPCLNNLTLIKKIKISLVHMALCGHEKTGCI